ncbi:MAG: ABC transporter permease [Acidobacteriota bacterium]|nr:MAG: ABC transporter permease [Acidobacteriota bacterium]
MRFVWAVFRREIKSYFVSPLCYTAIAAFLGIMGVLYYALLMGYERTRLRAAMNPLAEMPGVENIVRGMLGSDIMWAFLIIVPLLSMRMLAWERQQHTAELLLTAPMTTWHLVLGKFFGAVFVLITMLALAVWMPFVVVYWGSADPAPLLSGILGVLLYGALMLAIALLASSLTESTIQAGFLTLLFMAVVYVVGILVPRVPLVGENLEQFTPGGNLSLLARGVVDTQPLVYFLSMTALLLFLTSQIVDSQRWR